MVDKTGDLPVVKQCELASGGPFHGLLPAQAGPRLGRVILTF